MLECIKTGKIARKGSGGKLKIKKTVSYDVIEIKKHKLI